MRVFNRLLLAVAAALSLAAPGLAAEDAHHPEDHEWSFEGPFGTFDRASLQRGFQVYEQVCSACHSLDYVAFADLGREGGPFHNEEYANPNENPVVRASEADYMITDGPDDFGDMFERPGRPADEFPDPYANDQQARAANGGALPPNLSVITKARQGGPEYIRSLLLGYGEEPPEDLEVRPGLYYNPYFSGGLIAMPPQLQDGLVEYADGTEATAEQMAHDVVAFLAWAGEPHLEARKRMGMMVMIYLLILCALLWAAYKQVWSRIAH